MEALAAVYAESLLSNNNHPADFIIVWSLLWPNLYLVLYPDKTCGIMIIWACITDKFSWNLLMGLKYYCEREETQTDLQMA